MKQALNTSPSASLLLWGVTHDRPCTYAMVTFRVGNSAAARGSCETFRIACVDRKCRSIPPSAIVDRSARAYRDVQNTFAEGARGTRRAHASACGMRGTFRNLRAQGIRWGTARALISCAWRRAQERSPDLSPAGYRRRTRHKARSREFYAPREDRRRFSEDRKRA